MTTTSSHEPDFILEPNRPFGDDTPWGKPDEAFEVVAGIWWVTTSRHGGYWLSPERYDAMPELLRLCSVTGDTWFEEDFAAIAVGLAFSDLQHDISSTSEKLATLNDALPDEHQLRVLKSADGYTIGRCSNADGPIARDSVEYWRTKRDAAQALQTSEWTLRRYP